MKHLKLYEQYDGDIKDIVVYHGSDKAFTKFDSSFFAKGASDGILQYGHGFYFTDLEELAKKYGRHVIKAHLDIKNPLEYNELDTSLYDYCLKKFSKLRDKSEYEIKMKIGTNHRILQFIQNAGYNTIDVLSELGYDGIIIESDYANEYVAFYPEQIIIL
jgi:hypothetical protein